MPNKPEKQTPTHISLSYFVRKQQKSTPKALNPNYTCPPHHSHNKSEHLINKFIERCIHFKEGNSICEAPKRRNTSVSFTSKIPLLPNNINTQYNKFCKTYSETKKPSCITLAMKLYRASQEREAMYKRLAKAKPIK
jgi:hypothetical protein